MDRQPKHDGRLAFSMAIVWIVSFSFNSAAQDSPIPSAGTRLEWIEDLRQHKAQHLTPARKHKTEEILEKFVGEDPLNRYLGGIPGLHLRFGGVPSGGGLGIGPEYHRPDLLDGWISFRTHAAGSMKKWYLIETELSFSRLAGRSLDLALRGRRVDANSIDYYGPGPDSGKEGRTNYRREENALDLSIAFKPIRRFLIVGLNAGLWWFNTGPGQSHDTVSSEKLHTPRDAPGIDRQTHYIQTRVYLDVDSRDRLKDPHDGTHLRVELARFRDNKYDQYSFHQIEGSIEQYYPFFNKKRVVALRVRSVLSYPFKDNEVPFYMQPTLGGASDLRGYRRYRFYDNNSIVMNAEYRWEVFTLLDAVVFADAGKVFRTDSGLNLRSFRSDGGAGLRFKSRDAVAFRIDAAFSQEGLGLWFAFDHIF